MMLEQIKGAWKDFRNALLPSASKAEGASDKQWEGGAASAPPSTGLPSPTHADPRSEAQEDVDIPGEPALRSGEGEKPSPGEPSGVRRRLGTGILVAGLVVIAAAAVYWAPWGSAEPSDPEVVATYQGGAVTREQVRQELQNLPKETQRLYRSAEGLRALVGHAVVDAVTRSWAAEKQVDQRQTFKEAMKHASEEIKIADVSDQLHEGRIQVGEAEIQAYYDKNRQRLGDRPLVEVREQVRQAVVEEKEQSFVDGYLKDLKERASLQVDYSLLEVPEPTEEELATYYQNNRERFQTPERLRPYEEVRGEITSTLRAERERQLYAERKDRTLFTIHSRRTTLGEFQSELEELGPEVQRQYAGLEGKRKILDNLIERLLVVEDASEQAVDVKRSKEIDHARTELMAQFLHEEEVDTKLSVTDEEVRAEYDRNSARYAEPARVKVRYIRVGRGTTKDADEKALAKIREAEAKVKPGGMLGGGGQPADFTEVAKQYSEDPETAAKGGELDRWLGESGDALAELFEHVLHEELLGLKVGEISSVLPLSDSYYLFQIREKQESRQRSFEEAKELVANDLKVRKHAELTQNMERQLLDRMKLQIYDGRIRNLLAELGEGSSGK